MISKEKLKALFKNKLFIIISIIVIISIPVTVILINNYKQLQDQQLLLKQEELQQQEQQRIAEEKKKYSSICTEYNDTIASFNASVDHFNNFIDKISSYDVITNTEHIPQLNYIEENYKEFSNSGSDFNAITSKIETISKNTLSLDSKHNELVISIQNELISEYNAICDEYNELIKNTSTDFIKDISKKASPKESITEMDISNELDATENIISLIQDKEALTKDYQLLLQISKPTEDWIIQRISNLNYIKEIKAVNKSNDPNNLLGKEGGYSSCVYFSINEINQASIKGNNIIEKGTDAGGAVEVYPDLESAKNRCQYLSQFDNTLLYSGSYVIVGNMVIRTSYKLTNERQIEITNDLVRQFTRISLKQPDSQAT